MRYLSLPKRKPKEPVADTSSTRLQCSHCKTVFSNYMTQCPECGSDGWISYTELNPYSRMPLETVLQICGHIFWIAGTIFFLLLMWQTDSQDPDENKWTMYMAALSLALGVLFSALYFGLSEIIHRVLRLQRRLKAFHENYRDIEQGPSSIRKKHYPLIQYGSVRRINTKRTRKQAKDKIVRK